MPSSSSVIDKCCTFNIITSFLSISSLCVLNTYSLIHKYSSYQEDIFILSYLLMIQSNQSLVRKPMAKIQLRDVSLTYSAPPRDPVVRLYEVRKERLEEDLPAQPAEAVRALDHVNLTVPNG